MRLRELLNRAREGIRWRRTREARKWVLWRCSYEHARNALTGYRFAIDPLKQYVRAESGDYKEVSAALERAGAAKNARELVDALLPTYQLLNRLVLEQPELNWFRTREEIGWLIHDYQPDLGCPGDIGTPLAYFN